MRYFFLAILILVSSCKAPEIYRVEYSPASHHPVKIRPAQIQPSESAFAGSDSCRECHGNIYNKWQKTAHSRELTEQNFLMPPHQGDCSRCHSTSAVEKRVGCEACHGPRAEHVVNPKKYEPVECRICDIQRMCIQCHIRRIDPDFDPLRGWLTIDHGKDN